jgi:hypothetical protein
VNREAVTSVVKSRESLYIKMRKKIRQFQHRHLTKKKEAPGKDLTRSLERGTLITACPVKHWSPQYKVARFVSRPVVWINLCWRAYSCCQILILFQKRHTNMTVLPLYSLVNMRERKGKGERILRHCFYRAKQGYIFGFEGSRAVAIRPLGPDSLTRM